jgi:hypothetical protein
MAQQLRLDTFNIADAAEIGRHTINRDQRSPLAPQRTGVLSRQSTAGSPAVCKSAMKSI